MTTTTLADQVERAEFDAPFEITKGGRMVDRRDLYGPSVYHDDTDDVYVDGSGWTPLTGWTGQYGYRGAVMHPSEQLAGGIAEHIAETPGVYVVTEVMDMDDMDALAGWTALRMDGKA